MKPETVDSEFNIWETAEDYLKDVLLKSPSVSYDDGESSPSYTWNAYLITPRRLNNFGTILSWLYTLDSRPHGVKVDFEYDPDDDIRVPISFDSIPECYYWYKNDREVNSYGDSYYVETISTYVIWHNHYAPVRINFKYERLYISVMIEQADKTYIYDCNTHTVKKLISSEPDVLPASRPSTAPGNSSGISSASGQTCTSKNSSAAEDNRGSSEYVCAAIENLQKLLQSGALTQKEFVDKKAELLSRL